MPTKPPTHQPTKPKRRHTRPRESPHRRGYGAAWRKARAYQLRTEPLCRHCATIGRVEPATEVDHVVPIRRGGARLDPANLQALCKRCHSRKTMTQDMD